jgi:hypothetical protein
MSSFGRAGFFARHLDYFIVTQNSHPSPGLGTVTTIYRDPKLIATYRDWPARTTETNPHPGLMTRPVGRAKNAAPRRRCQLIKPPGR